MSAIFKEWHWEITTRCNASCRHCLADCGPDSFTEPDGSSAVRVVRIMSNLGCQKIMITGGEPLLYSGLTAVLQECRKFGIKAQIITNGTIIYRDLAKRLAGFVEAVGVSLDGSRPEINDPLRGQHTFHKACEAIRFFAAFVPVTVYFTASQSNLHDIESVIGLSRSLGAKRVHISEVKIAGRALSNQGLLRLSADQKQWLADFASHVTGVDKPEGNCNADLSVLYVSAGGMVFPCTELAFFTSPVNFGNILGRGFRNKIRDEKKKFIGNGRIACCYCLYAGNNLVFCLDNDKPCHLLEKGCAR